MRNLGLLLLHLVCALAQPAQDQCRPVGAVLPPQCPGTVGPPCPPCFTNTLPDYTPGDPIGFTAADRALLQNFTAYYLQWWQENLPPSVSKDGPYVFSGAAGRGNIFLRQYIAAPPGKANASHLHIASEYLNEAEEALPQEVNSGSYMNGHVGVWYLQNIVARLHNDTSKANGYLQKILDVYVNAAEAIAKGEERSSDGVNLRDCTLDTGLAGMIFGALLLNSQGYSGGMIPVSDLKTIVLHVLDIGITTGAALGTDYLQYESFRSCYLWGPGHGTTGALKMVFHAYHMYPQDLKELVDTSTKYGKAIRNTLDFFVKIQLPDGNVPTNTAGGCAAHYGDDVDARVQWCHGAPGFISIYLEGALLFNSSSYEAAAKAAAQVTWQRGLLVKGTMFCHGIAGNANMLLEASDIYKRMGDTAMGNKLAFRAKQFILWTLNWTNIDATRLTQSDTPYSMYQGNFAIPMMYIYALSPTWPQTSAVCQPGWNLCT